MRTKRRVLAATAVLGLATTVLVGGAAAASAGDAAGGSASNPIIVTKVSDVPEGAVQDKVSTYPTSAKCDTTRSWVLTVPAKDAVTHAEFQYLRHVPGVVETTHQEFGVQERTREAVPAQEEVSHQVYSYTKEVVDTKTQWYFAKYTETRQGTKQTRGGAIVWGPFAPWVKWSPETHTSWEDSDTPLGSPAPHAAWNEGNVYFERLWQARATGETRTVPNGSHSETSGEVTTPLGAPWVLLDGYPVTVVDSEAVPASFTDWTEWVTTSHGLLVEPVLPVNTDTHQYRELEPVTVGDDNAVAGYTEYFVAGSDPSKVREDASWVKESPGESWTVFNQRTVTDQEATPQVVTFYAYADGVVCPVVVPPVVTPPTVTPPVVTPLVPAELAYTGSAGAGTIAFVGLMALLVGGAAIGFTRRYKG